MAKHTRLTRYIRYFIARHMTRRAGINWSFKLPHTWIDSLTANEFVLISSIILQIDGLTKND